MGLAVLVLGCGDAFHLVPRVLNRTLSFCVWILALVRIALCAFPQNGWLRNSGDPAWGIIRNIPFVLLGAVICYLYRKNRKADRTFRLIWLYILLSFLFYIPVATASGTLPMLGMLMLPKTVCYILMICAFLRSMTAKKLS